MRSLMTMTAITYAVYVWLLIAGSTEAFASPSPVMIQQETVSQYLLMDTPTNRKITHSLVIDDQLLLIGTDEEGLFLRDTQKRWKKVLPYAIHEYLFESDGVYFAQIDKSARSSAQSQLFWYRSDDGVIWTEFFKPNLHQILAYDSKRDVTFKATKFLHYQQKNLTSKDNLGALTEYDTPLLRDILAIQLQSSSGNLLVGTSNGMRLVDTLGAVTDINPRLGLKNQSNYRFRLFINEKIMAVEANGHRIFISADGGTHWREITQLKPLLAPRGKFRYNQIHTLDEHRLVVSQNKKRYFVIDLLSGGFTECILPRFYDYQIALMGNELIASGHPPQGNNAVVSMGDRTDQKIHTPLFRMRLDEDDYCDKTHIPHQPITLIPNMRNYTGFVVHNDSVYAHNKSEVHLLPSHKNVLSKPIVGESFASGTKGTLYIGSAKIEKASGEGYGHYPLIRSINKGKDWEEVATQITIPKGAIYDDSLDVAYSNTKNSVLRYDLQNGGLEQSLSYDVEFKGSIQKLHVDNISRLWIQTSKQLYVSVEEGVSTIPLPFKDDPKIDLKGFAKLKDHIVVNYKDQLYLSKTDTIHWKPYRFNPCDSTKTLPIRILGYSETLMAVQELRYGHIWIINPLTDAYQRLFFPRKNGQIKRVAFLSNAVIVETTGIPFIPLKEGHRFTKPAPLLMYNLSLKNVRNHE